MNNKLMTKKALLMFEKFKTSDESTVDKEELSKRNTGSLKKVWSSVQTLYTLATSKNIPLAVKTTAIGALLYVIFPLDVIPDVTPFVGYVDDVAVVGAAIFKLKSFLDSPLGKVVVAQGSNALKKSISKSTVIQKEFTQSETGKEIVNAVKVFIKDKSEATVKEFHQRFLEALKNDRNSGIDYFASKEGKAIFNVKGEVIVDALASEYLEDTSNKSEINAINDFINIHGEKLVAQTIDFTSKISKDFLKNKKTSRLIK